MRRHRGSGSAFRELDTWIWRGDSTFPAGLDPTLLSGAQLVPWQLCCEIPAGLSTFPGILQALLHIPRGQPVAFCFQTAKWILKVSWKWDPKRFVFLPALGRSELFTAMSRSRGRGLGTQG